MNAQHDRTVSISNEQNVHLQDSRLEFSSFLIFLILVFLNVALSADVAFKKDQLPIDAWSDDFGRENTDPDVLASDLYHILHLQSRQRTL